MPSSVGTARERRPRTPPGGRDALTAARSRPRTRNAPPTASAIAAAAMNERLPRRPPHDPDDRRSASPASTSAHDDQHQRSPRTRARLPVEQIDARDVGVDVLGRAMPTVAQVSSDPRPTSSAPTRRAGTPRAGAGSGATRRPGARAIGRSVASRSGATKDLRRPHEGIGWTHRARRSANRARGFFTNWSLLELPVPQRSAVFGRNRARGLVNGGCCGNHGQPGC